MDLARRRFLTLLPTPWLAGAAAPVRRFEAQMAAFAEADRTAPSPPGSVLFVGSSTIRLWPDLDTAFRPRPVVQRGFGGATMAEVVDAADLLFAPHRPAVVVLYVGENDVAEGADAATVASRFRALQAQRRAFAAPPPPLLFVGLKPSPARLHLWSEMRRATVAVAALPEPDRPTAVLDLAAVLLAPDGALRPELYADDQLHLGSEGYRRLGAAIGRIVTPWLEAAPLRPAESTGQSG